MLRPIIELAPSLVFSRVYGDSVHIRGGGDGADLWFSGVDGHQSEHRVIDSKSARYYFAGWRYACPTQYGLPLQRSDNHR